MARTGRRYVTISLNHSHLTTSNPMLWAIVDAISGADAVIEVSGGYHVSRFGFEWEIQHTKPSQRLSERLKRGEPVRPQVFKLMYFDD